MPSKSEPKKPSKPTPKGKSRFKFQLKAIDAALAVVIVAALGFIAARLLRGPAQEETNRARVNAVTKSGTATPLRLNAPSGPRNPQWLLEEIRSVDAKTFSDAVTTSGLQNSLVDATPGCSQANVGSTIGVNFIDRKIANRVVKGELNFLLGFKQARCYRKGAKLQVLLFDTEAKSKFVELLGEVQISDLLVIPPSQMPEQLVSAMGVSKADYLDFANFARPAGLPDMIVRFGEFKKVATPPSLPIPSFPRAEILTAAAATDMAKNPNVRLLDVRSPDEFAATKSLPRATNVPYQLGPGLSKQFSWDVLRSQLAGSVFKFMSAVPDRNEVVIIVASGPSDARALYALSDLLALDYRKLFWVYDGLEGPSK